MNDQKRTILRQFDDTHCRQVQDKKKIVGKRRLARRIILLLQCSSTETPLPAGPSARVCICTERQLLASAFVPLLLYYGRQANICVCRLVIIKSEMEKRRSY
ncbi:hypothetical protein KKF55_01070 [Patescibacteria group bacterium]|nr:hypothetical protein [Patescibacteria group bacterium]